MLETWADSHTTFSWHPTASWRRAGVSRATASPSIWYRLAQASSRLCHARNLTRVVRPTRAIGVAAVLALPGH
jgi:hypothetical protein